MFPIVFYLMSLDTHNTVAYDHIEQLPGQASALPGTNASNKALFCQALQPVGQGMKAGGGNAATHTRRVRCVISREK